jgi:hypothetical protein
MQQTEHQKVFVFALKFFFEESIILHPLRVNQWINFRFKFFSRHKKKEEEKN